MPIEIKKVYSDNPYVDELVYYTLQLGLGTVLKLKGVADENETLEILRDAENYLSCMDGTAILGTFTYIPYEVLTSTKDSMGIEYGLGLPETIAKNIYYNPKRYTTLSQVKQDQLLECMKKWYTEHYEEKNNYYRMLNGQPPIDYPDVYLKEEDLPSSLDGIDISMPVHKMDSGTISILEKEDILERLYEEDPTNRGFLKHLGAKKIDIYTARKAGPFDALYVPKISSESIREMYVEKLQNNRTYTMRTIYSEAYKHQSDYYEHVLAVFIVLTTLIDIISRVQEFITRKEIFDIRSVEYLFESYGVEFFPEIPLKYQIAMIKNIHTLLKYKSSAQCMVDICSLFGFDNIKVFKYYLLKDHNVDLSTGEYVFDEDPEKQFTLKFIKLPLEDNVNDYIRVPSNHIDYDEITEGDVTWDGGKQHEQVKKEVLAKEFNIIRTKYISIDTIYDIAKMSVEQSYFFNMLFDNYEMEKLLRLKLPFIDSGHTFSLADVFSMLTALSYFYYGIKDDIVGADQVSVLHIVNGFNFKADMAELAGYIQLHHGKQDALDSLMKFRIPDGQIPSFEQMMDLFTNNLEVRDALIDGMNDANNLREYLIYWKLYNSLMTVELTFDHFKNPETGEFYKEAPDEDGVEHITYSEYFKHKEPLLYYTLLDCLAIEKEEERKNYISTVIDNIVSCLENYIDLDDYQSLFHNLPAFSAEAVKVYISKVINFFKSFKVDFLGLNTIYYLDDDFENVIRLIDDLRLERWFEKDEIMAIFDLIKSIRASMTYEEKVKLVEDVYLDIRTWVNKNLREDIVVDGEEDYQKVIKLLKMSLVCIYESLDIHVKRTDLEFLDMFCILDKFQIHYDSKENVELTDWALIKRDEQV